MNLYDSRDPACKTPYGAVPQGQSVTFTVYPPRDWETSRLWLCVWDERADIYREVELRWAGIAGQAEIFRCVLKTDDLWGLVWYHFRFELRGGRCGYLGRNGADGVASVLERPQNYQLSVYTPPTVPGWYGKGVTYHIFPDRFRRSKPPDATGLVGRRETHENWSDTPVFRPDARGEVRNRDFFGGNLEGVREKLPYLHSLGVETIYFSPIFEAASNHRYDTADYLKIDPMFGTERAFTAFCAEAKELGVRVILDGVFNHTGHDSRYFNALSSYAEPGAYQRHQSRYNDWYRFIDWPDTYESWWGFYTLPKLNLQSPSLREFLAGDGGSVVRHWLRAGASGWRLDVADELSDEFIGKIKRAACAEVADAAVIGEVWEDASNKVAYDERRYYTMGGMLDGVMNYPLRSAIIGYLLGGPAEAFQEVVENLRENYPAPVFYSCMNSLGTHDTERILTVLGAEPGDHALPREVQAEKRLSETQYALAKARLRLGTAILFAFPGSPTVYYGDEAGMQGYKDPLNRRGYPWGQEDQELLAWYRELGARRKRSEALRGGAFRFLQAEGPLLSFERTSETERVVVRVNRDALTVEIAEG